jgi:Uma2 family endonuclease
MIKNDRLKAARICGAWAMDSFTLDLEPFVALTDEQFFQLCQHHRDYQFERTAAGALIIMSPTGGETSRQNSDIIVQLGTQLGVVFDSSGGFKLPNGAHRSPDAAWVAKDRWHDLTSEQRRKFPPLCPDFLVELRSPSDELSMLRAKMQEYMENGAQLGWLINPLAQQVEIYRPNHQPDCLNAPTTLSGDPVLPGFQLDLTSIFC